MYKRIIFYSFFAAVLAVSGCGSNGGDAPAASASEVVELDDFETLATYKEEKLADPSLINYDDKEGSLIVYDAGLERVLEISGGGSITNEFGRRGNGPGEFQSVDKIFITEGHIYLVDRRRYMIHKFDKNGSFVSALDYGEFGIHRINKPHILNDRDVLIPSATAENAVYTLMSWDGEEKSEIGEIPEGSTDQLDYDDFRSEIRNRSVPSYFKTHSFVVDDDSKPDEFFLVYEVFPKVAKYNSSGELLWETPVIQLPEIDSVTVPYYEFMSMVLRQANAIRHLRKYAGGVSRDGAVFLSMDTSMDNPLWIHKFDSSGKLEKRYHIQSDVNLLSSFDIDFDNRKIFVATEQAEIRAYSF